MSCPTANKNLSSMHSLTFISVVKLSYTFCSLTCVHMYVYRVLRKSFPTRELFLKNLETHPRSRVPVEYAFIRERGRATRSKVQWVKLTEHARDFHSTCNPGRGVPFKQRTSCIPATSRMLCEPRMLM